MNKVRTLCRRLAAAASILLGRTAAPVPMPLEFVLPADTTQLEEALDRARSSIESVQAAREALGRPQLLIKFRRRLSSEALWNVAEALRLYQTDPSRSFVVPSDVEAEVYQLVADRWEPL